MRAVLMFHGVDRTGSFISIDPQELDALLMSIRAAGCAILPLERLLDSPNADEDAVAITFDDGFTSVHDLAAPILAAHDAPATLFLTTGYVGRNNQWPGQPEGAPSFDMMGWDQIEALAAKGWSIQAHSINHPDLRQLSEAQIEEELQGSQETIQARLGAHPEHFAYPYGYLDRRAVDIARRHFRYGLTTRMGALGASGDPLQLSRIDSFYLRAPWLHQRLLRFGGRRFSAFVRLRSLLRTLKRHPGEAKA